MYKYKVRYLLVYYKLFLKRKTFHILEYLLNLYVFFKNFVIDRILLT